MNSVATENFLEGSQVPCRGCARWIKTVMNLASIDVSKFQAHNTRKASSSKGKACHVPLTSIMKAASWKSADVFSKFYNKPVAAEE